MPMKNPPYPGRVIGQDCLNALNLSVTEGAKLLGVSRNSLSRVIHGHAGISAEMAIRFEKMGWGTADGWVRAQATYDLAQARKNAAKIKVRPLQIA